jgi:DNA repair ATPase RecN
MALAAVRPGEKGSLDEERIRLANAERLADLATQAVAALDESGEPRPAVGPLPSDIRRLNASSASTAHGSTPRSRAR